MRSASILIIGDDPAARRFLRTALAAQGFELDDAVNGDEIVRRLRKEPPDIILLDLKGGAMDACREIRASSEIPVIVVSARKTREDRTQAFEAGADGYVSKPIGIEELVACIRSVKRRVDALHPLVLALGDVEVDFETHEVRRKDRVVRLTAKEFKLLRCLASRAGEVISHRRILQAVWGPDYGEEVAYLRVFINQLRKKIEPDPANPAYIVTHPSAGYRLVIPQRARSAAVKGPTGISS